MRVLWHKYNWNKDSEEVSDLIFVIFMYPIISDPIAAITTTKNTLSEIIEQKKTEAKVMQLFSFKQIHQKISGEIFVPFNDQSNFKYQQLELNQKEKYLNLAKTETKSIQLMQVFAQKHHSEFHSICKSNSFSF